MKRIKRTFTFEGKRYYAEGKTEKEAELNREIMKRELENGKKQISRDMTVSAWCDEWVQTYKDGMVNKRQLADIKAVIRNFIEPDLGYMRLARIKPIHLQKVLNGTGDYSASYIRKIYQIVCGVFRTAYVNGLMLDDVTMSLLVPKGKSKNDRRAITDHERELTLKAAETSRGGLFVLVMLYCGLRPGEVAALRWNNIDLVKRVIHVREAVKADGSVGAPKSKAGTRDVPIPGPLHTRLLREEHGPFDLLVTNTKGGRYAKRSITDMWQVFREDMAALTETDGKRELIAEDLTLYCYRHTYCTDLQAAGVPINVARELMGHSDISITAKIYTHRSEKAFSDAADLINRHHSVAESVAKTAQPVEK